MNGTDAQVQIKKSSASDAPRRRPGWLWTLAGLVSVIAVCVGIRLLGTPQAAAQAPIVRPGSPTAPARPINSAPRQAAPVPGPSTPINAGAASPQTPAARAGVQPAAAAATKPAAAAAAKPASPPPSSTLQVMAVVNGEQITRTELGRECIRRYGEEVLESMVNR